MKFAFGYLIMDGKEINIMKAYAGELNKESIIECEEVDLLCSRIELDELITSLIKFREEINIYVQKNATCSELGITHMHYQDNSRTWTKDDTDIVVYVDLDR